MGKTVTLKSLKPGDIVRLVWKDHYRAHNTKITGTPGQVESFGRVVEVTDEGIALFQNRIINHRDISAEECLDGQFVLACDVVSIEVCGLAS